MELEPDPDTIIPENLSLDLKKDGTSNETNLNQQWAGAQTGLLGDGVPGPDAPVLEGNDNHIEHEFEAEEAAEEDSPYQSPTPTPN